MKNIYDVKHLMKNLQEYLKIIKPLLDAEDKYIITIFTYLINTINIDYKEIAKEIKKASKKGGDLAMTAAQRILGLIEEGRDQGVQQGMSKGRTEEKRASVIRMFDKDIALDDISYITGLSKKEVEKILKN